MAKKKKVPKKKPVCKKVLSAANLLSVAKVKKVLPESCGSVNFLAKYFGVSWITMKKFIDNSTTLTKLYGDVVNVVLNKARDNVYSSILDGDMNTTRWYLSLRDKDYKPKIEVDGEVDINIIINKNKEIE
jgi:hypothetical protein